MFINTYIERFKYLILSVVLLTSAMLVERTFVEQRFDEVDVAKFREVLLLKETSANIVIKELGELCQSGNAYSEIYHFNHKRRKVLDRRGMEFIVYKKDKLLFWSSNEFYFHSHFDPAQFATPVIFIDHSWFFVKKKQVDDANIIVLVLLKNEYPYQNGFLTSDFHDDFNLPSDINISSVPKAGYFNVSDDNNRFIMSLSNHSLDKKYGFGATFSLALYFASNLMFLFFFYHFLKKFRKRWISDLFNLGFVICYIAAREAMIEFKVPYAFTQSPLFDPQFYAMSYRFPSLGDLLLDAIFLWHFAYQLQRRIKEGILFGYSKKLGNVLVYVFPFIICSFGFGVDLVIKSLVVDSNINLEAHKVLEINNNTIFAYLVMATVIFAFILLANGFIYALSRRYDFTTSLLIFLPGFVLSVLLLLKENPFFVIRISILLLAFFLLLFMVNYRYKSLLSFSVKVLIIFVASIFITLSVEYYLYAKKTEIKKIYAFNLANEHDVLTEQLLCDAEYRMLKDTALASLVLSPYGREDEINKYLQNKYMGGFLNKYRLVSTVCGNSPEFAKENQTDNCDYYFHTYVFSKGQKIEKSSYHHIQNPDGSVSYVDSIGFEMAGRRVKLFIELKSRLMTEELGYPELLLNEERQPRNVFKEYSYARYNNGNLVTQKGVFHYSLSTNLTSQLTSEYAIASFGGFDHLLYSAGPSTVFIISNQQTTIIQTLISISYVFLFFFLLLMLLEFMLALMNDKMSFRLNFKEKIQASFVGVLVLSFVLIGVSIILLNLNQFRMSQYEQVNEKLQSITADLEQSQQDGDQFTPSAVEYLTYKLSRLSNIYFTDINVYDLDGILLASSRMEIYDWGLVSPRMNIDAFTALSVDKQSRFEHTERIGSLHYLSAYAVVKNDHNKALAYLNVPYFTKQSVITERLSSLVVAFINIYVLLIALATLFGVFISNKVTKPLLILKDKFREMKLGTKNEKIQWNSNDEIGGLIKDYNRMVAELEQSASKLASSERDMAWREMAKQIAHEIKNPLTPMKLNIQLLNRAWDARDDSFEDRLKRVSATLVEQIDLLAATASEFSNFAKSSDEIPQDIYIAERIRQTIMLFANQQDIVLTQHIDIPDNLSIKADNDKINRLLINIMKNAIQSIPQDKQGEITFDAKTSETEILLAIADNGCGIPPEIHHRLFEPNFTTKTSGCGLGLAICKTIVNDMNGKIWFETSGHGSCFYVSIPLKNHPRC